MAHITLITVGSLKEKYLSDAVAEYKKRLSAYSRVEEIELSEVKIANEDDKGEISRALDREADKILSSIPKDAVKIALCVEGREYSSPELAEVIRRAEDEKGKICLIIGSSYGLSDRVKNAADIKLSVSKLTFPHQLMRVSLFEALDRSYTIIAGKRYHK